MNEIIMISKDELSDTPCMTCECIIYEDSGLEDYSGWCICGDKENAHVTAN